MHSTLQITEQLLAYEELHKLGSGLKTTSLGTKMASIKVPKIIGELKIIKNRANGLSVWNNIKSGHNKIMIPCRSIEVGEEIIKRIKNASAGEIINIPT